MVTKYYLRFKDIPEDEISKIHRGEIEIGEEKGVSVFELAEIDNYLRLVFPVYIKDNSIINEDSTPEACSNDFSSNWWNFVNGKIPAYLVTGDEIGKGSDGEPLLKNIKIINKFKIPEQIKERKVENHDVATVVQLTGSVKKEIASKFINHFESLDSDVQKLIKDKIF